MCQYRHRFIVAMLHGTPMALLLRKTALNLGLYIQVGRHQRKGPPEVVEFNPL